MNPEANMELEARQESELRQMDPHDGEERADESNRALTEQEKDALLQQVQQLQEKARLAEEKAEAAEGNARRLAKEIAEEAKVIRLAEANARRLERNASVLELLETHDGLPRMETNTSAKPFSTPKDMNSQKRVPEQGAAAEASKKIAKFTSTAVIKQRQIPANIMEMEENVVDFMDQIDVNLRNRNGRLIVSKLAVGMGENRTNKEATLDNFNKQSVFMHLRDLLKDVLQCLHLSSDAWVCKEFSIFSMRPDILVVRWKWKIILVIEVENPGKDGSVVVRNTIPAGKVYDSAMVLHQMGMDHPFV